MSSQNAVLQYRQGEDAAICRHPNLRLVFIARKRRWYTRGMLKLHGCIVRVWPLRAAGFVLVFASFLFIYFPFDKEQRMN